jgi:NADPH2:quinone reductase
MKLRAVWMRRFGGPEVLSIEETPDPRPSAGQVLIEAEFAGVTFVETQMRAGHGPFQSRLPMIPGNAVGGVVVAAEDSSSCLGKTVVSSTGGSGGYAELVAVDAAMPIPVPSGLQLDEAVALLADGRTALLLTGSAGLKTGDTVLIEAAAGGVGSLLVQLAKQIGATVVAAAGGSRKLQIAHELGADLAVDYTREGWTNEVAEACGELDVVFDGVGGAIGGAAFNLLRPGGRMVSYGLASGEWADIDEETASQHAVALVRPQAPPERLRELSVQALDMAAAGKLRPLIGRRFPLEQAAAAHVAIESRETIGKTLLEIRR